MLENVIKRDGSVEAFDSSKLIKWSQWASEQLEGRVNWSSIVKNTLAHLSGTITSQKLQQKLIDTCLSHRNWAYYRMAGKLYSVIYRKELYDSATPPTVKELHDKLAESGLMVVLNYTDEEYDRIEDIIDHSRDFNMAHFQLVQARHKYSLANKITDEQFETPQFIYMRMAMALAEDEDLDSRLVHVKNWYDHFSFHRINSPGPNYDNLGTKSNGYASCCLFKAGDTAPSLAAHDHIAYTMTYMSAGTGSFIETRSVKDPVKAGAIQHKGKLPYFRSLAGAVKANLQGSRGGACTTYFTSYDPEANAISMLQNPRSTAAKSNKDIHFSMLFNRFIVEKAARDEDVFVFTVYSAPDLHEKLFSDDYEGFVALYEKYEQSEHFPKKYVSARDVLLTNGQQSHEVATAYRAQIDEINRNTPFKDPIYSSNLCVAPETRLLTKTGYHEIKTLRDQVVDVWNGEEWSEVTVRRTSVKAKLLTVLTQEGHRLECTPNHKFRLAPRGKGRPAPEVTAQQLRPGDRLIPYTDPNDSTVILRLTIRAVHDEGREDETYCFTEPKRNMGVFNGICAGNCLEILEPTYHYENVMDLYSASYVGKISFKDQDGRMNHYPANAKFATRNGVKAAYELEVGDAIIGAPLLSGLMSRYEKSVEVAEVTFKTKQPEVALCSIAGIIPANITSDAEYESAAYYAYKMIDKCIHKSTYALPHVGFTAKNRLNAGVGMLGLAYCLAKQNLKYNSTEGLQYIHELSETHAYYCVKAALRLGKELGNAPWINRTKWPEGWLPIDTYKKAIDDVAPFEFKRDWETLRQAIIDNKGIRFSCLIAHMPTESSSKASGVPNSVYPIRDLTLMKTDGDNVIRWCATDSDLFEGNYQLAWELSFEDMIKVYAVIQKFTDQGISADFYEDRSIRPEITTDDILREFFLMVKYGTKTKYYQNTFSIKADNTDNQDEASEEMVSSTGECEGVCTL